MICGYGTIVVNVVGVNILLRNANAKQKKLTEEDLVYEAFARCPYGAGMAYELGIGPFGYLDCSDILLGRAKKVKHEAQLPFEFDKVLSELQPSANGATTRPNSSKSA